MKKIPTIFKRNPENMSKLLNEPHPDCEWVFNGEGTATRKYDGTCCLISDGNVCKRREIKQGKPTPLNFIKVDFDETTGKTVGWVPVVLHAKEDCWHIEAFEENMEDGTYELLGPKIQGNPENFEKHTLLKHSKAFVFIDVPRTFDRLCAWMKGKDIEGIVFHHFDGRMAKIKKKDFGLKRKD